MAGTLEFLSEVQKILMENCNLNTTKIIPVKNINILIYCGSKQVTRIREFLYKNSSLFLERKKNILLEKRKF
jgi:hypothetical protein